MNVEAKDLISICNELFPYEDIIFLFLFLF